MRVVKQVPGGPVEEVLGSQFHRRGQAVALLFEQASQLSQEDGVVNECQLLTVVLCEFEELLD